LADESTERAEQRAGTEQKERERERERETPTHPVVDEVGERGEKNYNGKGGSDCD